LSPLACRIFDEVLAHTMGSLPHAPLASPSVLYLANVALEWWLVDVVAGGLVVAVAAGGA
jgi:hypothetical protein